MIKLVYNLNFNVKKFSLDNFIHKLQYSINKAKNDYNKEK